MRFPAQIWDLLLGLVLDLLLVLVLRLVLGL